MIWKIKDRHKEVGKRRVVKRFALFPKLIYQNDQYYWAWLQYYLSHEVYEVWQDISCGAQGHTWNVKERQLIENHH